MLTRTFTTSLAALAATTLLAAGPAIAAPAPLDVADAGSAGDTGSSDLVREMSCLLAIAAGSSWSLTELPPAVCMPQGVPTSTPSATPILDQTGPYPKTGSSAIDSVFFVLNTLACGAVCEGTWPNETPLFSGSD